MPAMSSAVVPQLIQSDMAQTNRTSAPSGDVVEESNLQNVQRSNKPRPLKIQQPEDTEKYSRSIPGQGFNFNQPVQQLNQDELVDLMNRINNGVKSGQFNSQLAQHIFRLYQQLKLFGDRIEQQQKNELNRVFVSLRQACCRDSGQLGTPCRLKIMELVELRAMGWRPNLAHSQYYLNRSTGEHNQQHNGPNGGSPQSAHHAGRMMLQAQQTGAVHQGMEFDHSMMTTPISAPPFGSVPINPFAFAPPAQLHQPMTSQHHMTMGHAELQQPMVSQPAATQAPSYYLIPASGAIFSHPAPPMMMPPPSPLGGPPMGFAMPPPMQQAPPTALQQQPINAQYHQQQSMAVAQNLMTTSGGMDQSQHAAHIEPETPWPRGAVTKPSVKFPQPQKVAGKNMFRDEIVIRNADSGKIMGVKGRRVAVVEEISKTIISFQKVPQGAKERSLTITGNSEETIQRAKVLIEETIRRNVSPTRAEGEGETDPPMDVQAHAADPALDCGPDVTEISTHVLVETENAVGGSQMVSEVSRKLSEDMSKFFELTNDSGVLKLSCADPEMLAAAQDALNAYFKRQTPLRRSQGTSGGTQAERQLRAERRKSMPSYSPDASNQEKGNRRQSPNREAQPCPPDEILSWRRREPPQPDQTNENQYRGLSGSPKGQQGGQKEGNKSFQKKPQQQRFAKSTPNLSGIDKERKDSQDSDDESQSQLSMQVVYTRDYLLQCSSSQLAHMSPGSVPKIRVDAPEILREVPGKFDGAEYKAQKTAAKTAGSTQQKTA